MMPVTVHLTYRGYLALRAGCAGERLTLPPGAGVDEVMEHVVTRCGLRPAERRHLFLSVNNTTGAEELADGDRIAVAILVGGG